MNDSLTARPRILMADAEPMSRALMEAVLRTEDRYEVLNASCGAHTLEAARRLRPDLLLLDMPLNAMTEAFPLCRALKSDAQTRRTPILLVTPSTSSGERAQVLEAGADDFLNKPFSRIELLARVRSLLRIKALNDQLDEVESVIYSLSRAVEMREGLEGDSQTERVIYYAVALGREIGLCDDALRIISQAAMLRDLGKIGLPDQILNKLGSLDEAEQKKMQQHTVLGEQIIAPLRSTAALIPIVRHHHERADGKGYPDGLIGEDIPLGARIVAIADAYVAMLSKRPYRPAMSPQKSLATLQSGAGRQWDSRLVAAFACSLERQPAPLHNMK